jgi:flagellar basal-body rod modification protein FlgD
MTTTSSTGAAGSTGATGSTGSTPPVASNDPSAGLGITDFISLLTTELKNQDPTSPVDNTQTIAQLAQFSTLSATTSMNTTISNISDKLDQIIKAQQAAAGTPPANNAGSGATA